MTLTSPITLDDDTAPFTVPACADPDQAALLVWAHEHPIDKPRPEMAGGRYVLVDPATGEPRKWTRVTTFCDDLANADFASWRNGMLVRGLVVDPTLMPMAHNEADEWKAYANIAASAIRQGGGWLAADLGTALHLATEHHDLGTGHMPPPPWDVSEWGFTLRQHGIEILPDWVERTVINPDVDCAGTVDRIAKLPDGRRVLLDLKTGGNPRKIGYAAQAAIYARASHAWTPDGYEPLPDVDLTLALIAWLPAKGGPMEIIEVDIARGWDVALKAHALRSSRSVKGIFTKAKPDPKLALEAVTPEPPPNTITRDGPDFDLAGRTSVTKERIAAAKVKHPGKLGTVWPAGVAPKGPWTGPEVAAIDAALLELDATEAAATRDAKMATGATKMTPPPTAPPWSTTDITTVISVDDHTAIAAAINNMSAEQRRVAAGWQRSGKLHGRPWGSARPGQMTEWTAALNLAALRCATCLHDDTDPDALTRAALSIVVGEDVAPSWATGAIIGSLSIDQANALEELAARFGVGDDTTTRQLGEAVIRVN